VPSRWFPISQSLLLKHGYAAKISNIIPFNQYFLAAEINYQRLFVPLEIYLGWLFTELNEGCSGGTMDIYFGVIGLQMEEATT
jgi:hypothetical protein